MPNNNNNKGNQPKVPTDYTHKGAQTPTYTPPPMPKIVPAKPSNQSKPKK
jgi:hypothetical protein